jgi:hypothetical protein
MSKRNGDKARAHREQKKKVLRRMQNRKLRRASGSKAVIQDVPNPDGVESHVITSQLRSLPGKNATDPATLEIVVFKAPIDRPND